MMAGCFLLQIWYAVYRFWFGFAQGYLSMALAREYTNNPELSIANYIVSGEHRMSELTLSPELLQISAEVQDAFKNKNRLLRWNRP